MWHGIDARPALWLFAGFGAPIPANAGMGLNGSQMLLVADEGHRLRKQAAGLHLDAVTLQDKTTCTLGSTLDIQTGTSKSKKSAASVAKLCIVLLDSVQAPLANCRGSGLGPLLLTKLLFEASEFLHRDLLLFVENLIDAFHFFNLAKLVLTVLTLLLTYIVHQHLLNAVLQCDGG